MIQPVRERGAGAPVGPRTVREMLERGRAFLERAGLESSRLESELLVAHALGLDRLGLFLALDRPLERAEIDAARELFRRRAARVPCAYLVGQREFYGRAFRVGPGVLIPRPETELLVDRARELLAGRRGARIADVGTGSGCLAISLFLELEGSSVQASDVSERALACARANAERLGASIGFHLGDGLQPLQESRPFDLIVMNPPYIDPAERAALAPEVREHEPPEALFLPSGDPGHWIRRLLDGGPSLLAPGGFLLIELGLGQAASARTLLEERGLPARFRRDLGRIERVLEVGPLG